MFSRHGKIALAFVAVLGLAVAQPKQKMAKDQAEADLINSIAKSTDPNAKIKLLDQWSKDYPQSDFAPNRQQEYLATYQALNRGRDVMNTAAQILKGDANDFQALRAILAAIYALNNGNPPAADLDTAEKTCNHMLTDSDAIFAADKMPPGMNAAQWAQVKPAMRVFAQRTLGFIYLARKDNPRAETELTKALQLDPTQAATSQMLAGAILAQNKTNPEKQPLALYQYARAVAYTGPNSLPAQARQQLQGFLTRAYTQYHGSSDGLDQVLAAAKNNAMPPADFKIASTADIEIAKAKAEEEAARANPMMALWTSIKKELTGDNGDAYFESSVKDTAPPKFKGKLVSMTPAMRPKELVLAIENGSVPDATLKFEMPLPGKMDPGAELEFEGVPKAYAKSPYMLTFEVEREKLTGWAGKNAPARKAAPKKAAPK